MDGNIIIYEWKRSGRNHDQKKFKDSIKIIQNNYV